MRAAALRWRLTRLDWRACFIPGAIQVADLGTKPLAQQRMQELKVLLGMGHAVKETNAPEIAVETVRDDLEKKKDAMHQEITVAKLKVALFVGILAAEMTGAEAAQSHEDTEEETGVRFMMILYTILVMLITLGLQKIFERLCSWFESSRGFTLRLSVSGGAAEEPRGIWREQNVQEADARREVSPWAPRHLRDAPRWRGPRTPSAERNAYSDLYGRPETWHTPAESPSPSPEERPDLPPRFNVFGQASVPTPPGGGEAQALQALRGHELSGGDEATDHAGHLGGSVHARDGGYRDSAEPVPEAGQGDGAGPARDAGLQPRPSGLPEEEAQTHEVGSDEVYTTITGGCYHFSRSCVALRQARTIFQCSVCRDCLTLDSWRGRALHGVKSVRIMRARREHARADGSSGEEPRQLLPCMQCTRTRA